MYIFYFKKKKEESIRVFISSTRMASHSYVKKLEFIIFSSDIFCLCVI